MKQIITAAVAGLGNRGNDIYAHYQLVAPNEMKVTAVAEPIREKREAAAKAYGIEPENCFETVEELLEQPQLADILVVATQDRQHVAQAVAGMEKGYHIICEKPISPDVGECLLLQKKAHEYGKMVAVGHVLRYTPFFHRIKELLDSGRIGEIVSIQAMEQVAYWHQAHSYVRGNWRDSKTSSPMILAKSCHDLDIFVWLLNRPCSRISSYGSTYLFRKECAPEGSTSRCLDGCTAKESCPYDAEKIYITNSATGIRKVMEQKLIGDDSWPCNILSQELTEEAVYEAIRKGPYGRCVYYCDNDVVDHQVVNMEFEGGVTVDFTMSAFTAHGGRTIKLQGTLGEIEGDLHTNRIVVTEFGKEPQVIDAAQGQADMSGHAGGDNRLIHDFLEALSNGDEALRTGIDASIQSHIMASAAEYSRLHEGESIRISDYIEKEQYKEGGYHE